jgi:hypothetical protein
MAEDGSAKPSAKRVEALGLRTTAWKPSEALPNSATKRDARHAAPNIISCSFFFELNLCFSLSFPPYSDICPPLQTATCAASAA